MDAQFSQRVKDILAYSKEEAIRLGNSHISPEHLFASQEYGEDSQAYLSRGQGNEE
jgi:hypothetical protein